MTDVSAPEAPPKKKSFLARVALPIILALVGAGAGYSAIVFGMLPDLLRGQQPKTETATGTTYVPVPPVTISLTSSPDFKLLRFSAQLATSSKSAQSVSAEMPRILDVINGYLRTLSTDELIEPSALITLRAQLLRRVQTVVGPEAASDLLVSEFFLG